jgi:hypothetical protein
VVRSESSDVIPVVLSGQKAYEGQKEQCIVLRGVRGTDKDFTKPLGKFFPAGGKHVSGECGMTEAREDGDNCAHVKMLHQG